MHLNCFQTILKQYIHASSLHPEILNQWLGSAGDRVWVLNQREKKEEKSKAKNEKKQEGKKKKGGKKRGKEGRKKEEIL